MHFIKIGHIFQEGLLKYKEFSDILRDEITRGGIIVRICIQTGDIVDRVGLEKGYKLIKKCGFEAIDWNIDHAWRSSDLRSGNYRGKCIFEKSLDEVVKYYSKELEIIKKNNLVITQAHAPFPAFFKDSPEILDYTIGVYKRVIEFCDYIGCRNIIIHGISLQLDDNVNTYETISKYNYRLYSSLIPVLKKCDVVVCLENLFTGSRGINYVGHCSNPCYAAKEIDKLNKRAGREAFGLCLDTGHLNILAQDFKVYVPILGKRIKTLHIHDNDGVSDQHLAPFAGKINWGRFCDSLKEIGYDGDLDFETFNQTNKVLDFDEKLLPAWMKMICKTGEVFRDRITG